VEDEDEEPLETVESGEDVSDEDGTRVNVEQTEQPREAKQNHQHKRALQPPTAHNPIQLIISSNVFYLIYSPLHKIHRVPDK